tara:strand:- start:173 stop:361 length:189 start_codon:yes stop_codon:yes gene_type:complete
MSDFKEMLFEAGREMASKIEPSNWQDLQSKDMSDRHNSDEEELRRESAELRDYNDFFDMEDR